jgi:hypothetical protein
MSVTAINHVTYINATLQLRVSQQEGPQKNAKFWGGGNSMLVLGNCTDKGKVHLNNQGLYSMTITDTILLAFQNTYTILRLFLSLVVTNCSFLRLKKHQQ